MVKVICINSLFSFFIISKNELFLPKYNRKNDPHSQRGNVLFLILIAVALFAALSYAVTSSERTSGSDTKSEQTALVVSQVIQYGADLKSAYLRMKISNECTDDQISYENNFNEWSYVNSNAPTDFRCHMFNPAGGSVAPLNPNIIDSNQPVVRSSQWQFLTTQSTGGFGSATDDLIAYGKVGSESMCKMINQKVNNLDAAPEVVIAIVAAGPNHSSAFNPDFGPLWGKTVGCFYAEHVYSRGYWFYEVLEIR